MVHRLSAILLGLIVASGAYAHSNVPPFVAKLIAQYKAGPPDSSPGAVWRYRYKGATVYYVPRLPCCDIMSRLYTAGGQLICKPDGGIAGNGDGKCPDFFAERKAGLQLWSDPRGRKVPAVG